MKVNVNGRGVIPGVGMLAPQRGIDLTIQQVSRILNYRQFTVSVTDTGKLITKTNITSLFGVSQIEKFKKEYEEKTVKEAPAVKVVHENKIEEEPQPVVFKKDYEEPMIEIVDDSFTIDTPANEERHSQMIGNNPDMEYEYEDEVKDETAGEEVTDETNYSLQRKKNRKRNRH